MNLLFIYLSLSVLYVFFFALVSKFRIKSKVFPIIDNSSVNFQFLIPAYKEDGVIIETVKNILSQKDLSEYDEIVVIADQLKKETINHLKALEIKVVGVYFEKSTKAKAINRAMKALSLWRKKMDAVVLLDADNQLVEGFITKTKSAFVAGHQVIQCHRIAKNLDTPMAKLDAISEEINNSIFRLGHVNLGFSAALIGSGLVMDYELFREYLKKIDVVSGFDKQLELDLLQNKIKIEYLADAFVLDEKVRNTTVFETQRTRWIAAQFNFAKQNFFKAWVELFKNKNLDFFDKVIQFILPPRLILLGVLLISLIISVLVDFHSVTFITLNLLLWAGFLLAIPSYLFKTFSLNLFKELPMTFWKMIVAIFHIRKAKQTFLHTPHGVA